MQIKVYNPSNLTQNQIDKNVTRVKAIIMNSDSEILVCHTNDNYSFIGGHVENNESLNDALNRELKEETGLNIDAYNIQPFFKIEKMNYNHYNTNMNSLSEIYYYLIYTDSKYSAKKMKLDDSEIAKSFQLEYINIEAFINCLYDFDAIFIDNTNNPIVNLLGQFKIIDNLPLIANRLFIEEEVKKYALEKKENTNNKLLTMLKYEEFLLRMFFLNNKALNNDIIIASYYHELSMLAKSIYRKLSY